jgi:1,4-alpha-glucan branching enzyme
MSRLSVAARAIISGRHPDPFHYLGPHTDGDKTVVRVFLPDAKEVIALGESREERLERLDPAGLFCGPLDNPSRYKLRARFGDDVVELEDPYRFPPVGCIRSRDTALHCIGGRRPNEIDQAVAGSREYQRARPADVDL